MLLSRVAEQLYWAARYLERAEDTARIVGAYTEVMADTPIRPSSSWLPLLATTGSAEQFRRRDGRADESGIVRFLLADTDNPGSVAASVGAVRENLRATREVLPREAWQAVNDLHLFVTASSGDGVPRRGRARFVQRVVADAQRIDGIVEATMSHDAAYEFLRLGQAIERADMTTRVLGVRAAALALAGPTDGHGDAVEWMGVLRSLSAWQMYQRWARGPVDGQQVVEFLLHDRSFPRSVAACLGRARAALDRLPRGDDVLPALVLAETVLASVRTDGSDGRQLDAETERVQAALSSLSDRLLATYGGAGSPGG